MFDTWNAVKSFLFFRLIIASLDFSLTSSRLIMLLGTVHSERYIAPAMKHGETSCIS